MDNTPERIVCIDDEQSMRTLMRDALENAGFEGALATCMSGEEFLNRFHELQPDLILLDLLMPEMDGLEMLRILKDEPDFDNMRVVMVTGVKKLVMTPEYKRLGVIGIIHKPFETSTLLKNIQDIWGAYKAEDTE